ncbi:MAG: copper transporter [Clostridiaceae bacterium]|nr:copper transporter [Clostridiaceae bacterium]
MVIDIKYYIITIAAIFISLGIGIFIGFNMDGEEIYLKQQQQLVDSLENRFSQLRMESESLHQTIEQLELEQSRNIAFIENAYKEFTENKLKNFNIAIIQTSEDYSYNSIRECIENAGGNVPTHLVYNSKLLSLSKQDIDEINHEFNINLDKNQIIMKINKDIVDFIMYDKSSDFLKYVLHKEFIQSKHNNIFKAPIDYVIIAGGTEDKRKEKITKIDLDLIKQFKSKNIKAVGVENADIGYSHIPYYKNSGVSTIDNIDSIIGQISLVLVLEGKEGFFGIKDYAEKLVPIGTQ